MALSTLSLFILVSCADVAQGLTPGENQNLMRKQGDIATGQDLLPPRSEEWAVTVVSRNAHNHTHDMAISSLIGLHQDVESALANHNEVVTKPFMVVNPWTPVVLSLVLIGAFIGAYLADKQGSDGPFATLCATVGFMCCSSMMLVVNKICIVQLPYPSTVLALQLMVTAGVAKALGVAGLVEVEPLEWKKVRAFGATPFAFLLTLIANMKILQYANIETFIMIRTSTPIFTSLLDYSFLGRELPDTRSAMSLLLAMTGAMLYMETDSQFTITSYHWAAAWLCIFLFDQVYIKHIISTVQMSSWTRVYYQNLLAGLPVTVMACFVEKAPWNLVTGWVGPISSAVAMLAISCGMSIAMSFFSFKAREALSATAFTVVGNACKVVSVLVNVLLWDKHASGMGLIALGLCLTGSGFYRVAPMRADKTAGTNEKTGLFATKQVTRLPA